MTTIEKNYQPTPVPEEDPFSQPEQPAEFPNQQNWDERKFGQFFLEHWGDVAFGD